MTSPLPAAPSSVPVTLPALLLSDIETTAPAWLLGDGTNRSPNVPMIDARSDIAAIREWLAEYTGNTLRGYSREIERFYRWCIFKGQKPISSVTHTDIVAYERFMAAPDPDWCAKRYTKRTHEAWRPFEGPLDPRSRKLAMTIIGACFEWLTRAEYLGRNPTKLRRRRNTEVAKKQSTVEQHHIPRPTLARMIAVLQTQAQSIPIQNTRDRARFERMLFVTRLLGNTGLRREEAVAAVLKDVFPRIDPITGETGWYISVLGKGNKFRNVVFTDVVRTALDRYRTFNQGLAPFFKVPDDAPLILRLGGYQDSRKKAGSEDLLRSALSESALYAIVEEALAIAANELRQTYPEDASLLDQATPHWFRHSFATNSLDAGIDIKVLQDQLGHENIATTAEYLHPNLYQMYVAFNAMSI
jgi:integrase/recombinase XerD